MAESKRRPERRHTRKELKTETKLVMEAFLRRVQDEEGSVGHVGRCYHDARKFKAKTPDGQEGNIIKPSRQMKGPHKGSLEREDEKKRRSLKHPQGSEEVAGWDTSDEEICQAEEKKHGFKTAIKKLIKRQKKKKESEKSKVSQEFLDSDKTLERGSKSISKANTLRRRKSTKPSVDCIVGPTEAPRGGTEDVGKQKKSGLQKIRDVFRKGTKKGDNSHSEMPARLRPITLALNDPPPDIQPLGFYSEEAKKFGKLVHVYCAHTGNDQQTPVIPQAPIQDVQPLGFYSEVAKKLDELAQVYCAHTGNDQQTPVIPQAPIQDVQPLGFYSEVAKKLDELAQVYCAHTGNDQQTPVIPQAPIQGISDPQSIREKEIERIVMMLQDQGDEINEKMKDDPLLQRHMSYDSFTRLVEVFTANVEGQIAEPAGSPELTKIVLTMELTRRVAGICSHPVQQLMGYSMDYMDMFVPWLQRQGGWEAVLHSDDIPEHQID